MATNSWSTLRPASASYSPRNLAKPASAVNSAEPMGNVPYAATSDREFAVGRYFDGTSRGTDASFAGDHINVNISRSSDTTTRPGIVSTHGSVASTRPRPMSQTTITRL